jgi:hypothetical protein
MGIVASRQSDDDHKNLSSIISKHRQGCEISLKRNNRTSNPYSKKFSKFQKKRKGDPLHSDYSNKGEVVSREEYTVTSSYSKRNGKNMKSKVQETHCSNPEKNSKISRIRMKKYKKPLDSLQKNL